MYLVTASDEPRYLELAKALDALENLKVMKPNRHWELFIQRAEPKDDDPFELLYALAIQLVDVSKINPFNLTMELTNIAGDKNEISAYSIIQEARRWQDQRLATQTSLVLVK